MLRVRDQIFRPGQHYKLPSGQCLKVERVREDIVDFVYLHVRTDTRKPKKPEEVQFRRDWVMKNCQRITLVTRPATPAQLELFPH